MTKKEKDKLWLKLMKLENKVHDLINQTDFAVANLGSLCTEIIEVLKED